MKKGLVSPNIEALATAWREQKMRVWQAYLAGEKVAVPLSWIGEDRKVSEAAALEDLGLFR